ncbi:Disease resistance protein [Corchorus capsularis]|uniref:Disease resistance protein n=1 Tax=Corchorus capsularis TaxID=210143 RepID=A0A1R3G077_COCAP|nr:Disease resistance protein [Corchorus capsularis]
MDPSSIISLLSLVLEYVTPIVTREIKLITGARDEVLSLHAELQFIFQRLRKSKDRLAEDEVLRTQIESLAYESKGVIARFVAENDIQKQRNWAEKTKNVVHHVKTLRDVAIKVQNIKHRIEELDALERKYGNDHQGGNRNSEKAQWLEKLRRDVEMENVIGFDVAERKVIEMLTNKRLRRDVISIMSMAGSGKTTLAKKIYGHTGIAQHFLHRAWVFVPRRYRIRDLLMAILENLMSIGDETSKLEDAELAEKLTKCLESKRYLISWDLLEKLVFKDEKCPQHLVKLGKQIATKCDGLPLAILSVASLLARNREYLHCIPEHLKKCFLYLGAFPNGSEILARQVIYLWIAEELVKAKGGEKLEVIAKRYLEELIDLSLIQVGRRRSDGGVRTIRVHGLWRYFCIDKNRKTNFLDFQKDESGNPHSDGPVPRKVSIQYEVSRYISSNSQHSSNIESLLCFCNKGSLGTREWTLLCQRFKFLRVLNLGSTSFVEIPKNIENLCLLKYLKMNPPCRDPKSLTSSICRLPNLQTLDMRNTNGFTCVPRLPSDIWGMQNLRHLLLPRLTTLPKSGDPYQCLYRLQTLSDITPDRNTAALIIGSKFHNLRKLTLYSEDKEKTKQCLERLYKLDHLENLKIVNQVVFPKLATAFPKSLVKVTLVKTNLSSDQVGMFQNLPNLQVLKLLTKSVVGEKLEMGAGSFLQLRFLFMEEIGIRSWVIGYEALESLEELNITRCHELHTLPKQLWYLPSFRKVKLNSPSQSLKRNLDEQLRLQPSDQIQIHF